MSKSKIITRIIGGIGNQLFSYAAARRLALANNAELAIDHVSGFVRDYKYQRRYQLDHFSIPCRKANPWERMEPFSRYRRYVKLKLYKRLPFEKRGYIKQEFIDFDSRLLQIRAKRKVYLEGYWQSEKYFKDVEETIRADLRIIPPEDPRNQELAQSIQERTAVAVHARFFDAPGKDGLNNLSSEYYSRTVKKMESMLTGAHYFLFSDKPEAAREIIPLPDDRVTCIAHNKGDTNAYKDLWLMTKCKHFIIANSTFSWWGAWLAECPDKIVIAPSFEKRDGVAFWGIEGLIPEEWIKC